MKRVLLALMVVVALIFATPQVQAQTSNYQSSISSGLLAASAVVYAKPCVLTDLAVYTDGTNEVTVTLYDNATTNSGTVIGKVVVPGANKNGGLIIPIPVRAQNGIYMVLTGTGGSAIVFYSY